jgi:hypothetical protein
MQTCLTAVPVYHPSLSHIWTRFFRLDVFKEVVIKIKVFWNTKLTPCILVTSYTAWDIKYNNFDTYSAFPATYWDYLEYTFFLPLQYESLKIKIVLFKGIISLCEFRTKACLNPARNNFFRNFIPFCLCPYPGSLYPIRTSSPSYVTVICVNVKTEN